VRGQLERAKGPAEANLLLVTDRLPAQHDDGVLGHRLFNCRQQLGVRLAMQVRTLDLGPEQGINSVNY
jgi:hypothetical protein